MLRVMTSAREKARAAVQADVAKLAGVSSQTVSRVVNRSGYVGLRTRERVLAAMRELDYRPNSAARALVTGRTRTLGVVSVDTTAFGPASILLSVERAAHTHGYAVSVASIERLDDAAVLEAIERLERQGVEGIVLNAAQEAIAQHLPERLAATPVVAIEDVPAAAVPIVSFDQETGAATATRLLLELGHRAIAHVAGPSDWLAARRRIAGWQAALEAAGVEPQGPVHGDWTARSGYEHGLALSAERHITAVFAANDQMALGVLRAMQVAGRTVPGDVSVIGFDDIPEARYLTPPLTTVRQDFEGLGRESLRLLLDAIEAPGGTPPRVSMAPELVVRESTARAPS
jgi:DNA-binding LacI/PurR family transcriptional regulator